MMQSFYSDAAVAAVGSQLKYGTSVNPLRPPTSIVTLTHAFKNKKKKCGTSPAHIEDDGSKQPVNHHTLTHNSKYNVVPYYNPSTFILGIRKEEKKNPLWTLTLSLV